MTTEITPRISKMRLLMLADYLDTIVPSSFNFASFFLGKTIKANEITCGSTGCALGHAAAHPYFANLGLALTRHEGIKTNQEGDYQPSLDEYNYNVRGSVLNTKTGTTGFTAAGEIFGLNYEDTRFLFNPLDDNEAESGELPSGATAAEVAQHIRNFCRSKFPTV